MAASALLLLAYATPRLPKALALSGSDTPAHSIMAVQALSLCSKVGPFLPVHESQSVCCWATAIVPITSLLAKKMQKRTRFCLARRVVANILVCPRPQSQIADRDYPHKIAANALAAAENRIFHRPLCPQCICRMLGPYRTFRNCG